MSKTSEQRFWAKVRKPAASNAWQADRSHCWEWVGAINSKGYGNFGGANGRTVAAHRASYEFHCGGIPKGLDLDHLCRNRACVNPAHLEPVTRQENLRRGAGPAERSAFYAAWRLTHTHCKRGHEFTPENTILSPRRACRACGKLASRACYVKRRDELRALAGAA